MKRRKLTLLPRMAGALLLALACGELTKLDAQHLTIGDTRVTVNRAPTLDLNGNDAGTDFTAVFTSGGPLVSIVDANTSDGDALVLDDPDDRFFTSATIEITNNLNGNAETLAVSNSLTMISASLGPAGQSRRLTLTGFQTREVWQTLLRSVVYNNTAGASINTTPRRIVFTLSDGNLQTAPATSTVYIDTPGPCTVTCPANVTVPSAPGRCDATVEFAQPTTSGTCGRIFTSHGSGALFPVGTTTVTGSSPSSGASCSFTITVIDATPPSTTCPSGFTVEAAPGANSAIVEYAVAMASDNCAVTSVTSSPASGSSFPLGTTTVTSTATDASGNTANCTFDITVNPGPTPVPATTLANIATRLRVETADNVLIGGIIITGTQPKKLIVRAIGPSLSVDGALANPQLEMFNGDGAAFAFNDNWEDAPNRQEIIDSTIPPPHPLEAAFLGSLAPGTYTAIVSGVEGGTGIGVVEAYDLDRSFDSKFANIATRGLVQRGDDVMIGGLIILGDTEQKVLVRAIGPSLPVDGSLADPTLDLVNGNGNSIGFNNNWRETQEAEIEATTIPPSNDLESAVLATLAPGSYTAVVRGADDTTGVALVEVYALK